MLRDQLIGAWHLESYVEEPTGDSPTIYRMGKEPKGLIMYTPDGYMSAQLMHPERVQFASGDWFDGTDAEYRSEATTYIAYSGRFFVDEAAQSLRHEMQVSLYPGWVGQVQPRGVRIEGDLLHLSSLSPIMSGGVEVMSYLTWRRAPANHAAEPEGS